MRLYLGTSSFVYCRCRSKMLDWLLARDVVALKNEIIIYNFLLKHFVARWRWDLLPTQHKPHPICTLVLLSSHWQLSSLRQFHGIYIHIYLVNLLPQFAFLLFFFFLFVCISCTRHVWCVLADISLVQRRSLKRLIFCSMTERSYDNMWQAVPVWPIHTLGYPSLSARWSEFRYIYSNSIACNRFCVCVFVKRVLI